MARTLGSEEQDQVTKPGRRVLIGWAGPADPLVALETQRGGNAQSLPRDLSLAKDKSLRQRFVPELQMLRQKHSPRNSASVQVGLQAEVFATLPPGCGGPSSEGQLEAQACGFRLGSFGELSMDQPRGLVVLNLSAGNNSRVRAGPIPPASAAGYEVHMYIDHSILELIINNITAFVAYWSPPAETTTSLEVALVGQAAGHGAIEGWVLATANANRP